MAQISGAATPAAKPTTENDLRIAVFGVGLNNVADLSAQLARIVCAAAQDAGPVRLAVFGLGALESESALRKNLEGTRVTLEIDGVLGAAEVCERLRQSSVQLFIRSGVSACRSSVVAGICCGLPIVGWQDWDTAYPVTEAGLRTAPCGDEAGLIRELASVLTDGALRSQLSLKSAEAAVKYFSWERIAAQFQVRRSLHRPQRFAQRPIFVNPRIIPRVSAGGNVPPRDTSAAMVTTIHGCQQMPWKFRAPSEPTRSVSACSEPPGHPFGSSRTMHFADQNRVRGPKYLFCTFQHLFFGALDVDFQHIRQSMTGCKSVQRHRLDHDGPGTTLIICHGSHGTRIPAGRIRSSLERKCLAFRPYRGRNRPRLAAENLALRDR